MNKHKVLVIAVSLINVLLAIGKDSFLAGYLGTSKEADAFFLAFFIPDMLGNNLLASAFGIAAAPILVNVFKNANSNAITYAFIKIQRVAVIVAVAFTAVILGLDNGIVTYLGAGFDAATSKTAMLLLLILSPTISIYPLVSVRVMMLQVKEKFGLASMTALFLNLLLMGTVLGLGYFGIPRDKGVFWLVGAIVSAAVIQLMYLKTMLHSSWRNNKDDSAARTESLDGVQEASFVKPFASVVLLLFLSQLLLYFERFLGSNMDAGSIAAISYAYRISQFSILVFGYSIAFVIYPKLIEFVAEHKIHEARELYLESFRQILLLSIPVAIGLSILREPVIRILFAHYSFDDTSVAMSAKVLLGYGISVAVQGLVFMNLRLLAAFKRFRSQVYAMSFLVAIAMGIEYFLVRHIGLIGIGLGTLIYALAGAVVTTGFIFNRLGVDIYAEILHIARLFIGNLPAVLAAFLLSAYWQFKSPLWTVWDMLIFGIFSGVLVLGASYFGVKGIERVSKWG